MISKTIESNFIEHKETIFAPDNENLALVKGNFNSHSKKSERMDILVLDIKTGNIIYKKAGINGSVDWFSDTEIRICDYPGVPVSEHNEPCYVLNVITHIITNNSKSKL